MSPTPQTSSWKRRYDDLKRRIDDAYNKKCLKSLPDLEEIERLVSIAERGFKGTKFYDYVMSKNMKLRNNLISKKRRIIRIREKQKEERRLKKVSLDKGVKDVIFDIASRYASEYGIRSSDSLSIEMDKGGAILKFNGDRVAFDWPSAIISKATSMFPDIVPMYNDRVRDLYNTVESSFNITIEDKDLDDVSYTINNAFNEALSDDTIYSFIDKESRRIGASMEIVFLKLMEEEGNIRQLYV